MILAVGLLLLRVVGKQPRSLCGSKTALSPGFVFESSSFGGA
jgi:hypothetical protein